MAGHPRRLPASDTCRHGTTHDKRCPREDRCDEQRRLDEMEWPGRRGAMPPLASARIIDLKTARLTLVRNADRVLPATLGAVPLTFRQWRGELERQSPRLRWPAWIAAVAAHAIIGTAILLYATM